MSTSASETQKKLTYILRGAALMAAYSFVQILSNNTSWLGDQFGYNIGRISGGAFSGGFLGLFVYWVRKKTTKPK